MILFTAGYDKTVDDNVVVVVVDDKKGIGVGGLCW